MKPCSAPYALALSLAALAACGGPKVGRTIGHAQVGTDYARLTGYFATSKAAPGGRHEEGVPGHLQHDIVLDEATLLRLTPAETCFDVLVRSESRHDEPLEHLAPSCEADGAEHGAIVQDERVSVVDYPYQGTEQVVRADAVAANEYLGLSIEQPAQKVFRVVSRRATLCCAAAVQEVVSLTLDNERREVADYNYNLTFEWKLR